MEKLTQKTFQTSRSLTYTYYDTASVKPGTSTPEKPTLVFLHGFPDSAFLWSSVLPHFSSLPNRIIVPDLLGYGGTSKPTDPSLYNSKDMAADLKELLASEGVTKIVVIGHDWGSFLAARVWIWHPEIVVGAAFLNVPYMPPDTSKPFNLEDSLQMTEKATGFPRFAYWELFTADDGAKVSDAHLDRFWSAVHGDRENWMRDMFCVRGAFRNHLINGTDVGLKEYAKEGSKWEKEWMERMRKDRLEAPFCWYKAMADNHHYEVEKGISAEKLKVTVPAFYLGCTGDEVCLPQLIEMPRKAGLLPDLTVKVIDSGHWCTMEKPDEVGQNLLAFIKEKF
ncbi:uncharacterized protein K452DRAFT_284269 [Aplosporella prunicola CBS 121167]|uniref:AB hydrolase-1 domain-containing protein n=1 Tax=Aplosporella prunicola CBS 121167 TaxID=1176127 RepID=A0A6A6BNP3_9PEZI|nr:uncharacterized protein K452DRAFT_284269 [Aplosporella prunicola CBS 121167]KAF2144885.1 hypothetical protein K452DRAFT_284269 [Aplosporella prunicola CBS 121167]